MSEQPFERRGAGEITPVERHILTRLDSLQEQMQSMTTQVIEIKTDTREIKQDITDAKNHSDRLTRLEQRMEDADAARKSIGENLRWVIGLVIIALLGVAGLFFKK